MRVRLRTAVTVRIGGSWEHLGLELSHRFPKLRVKVRGREHLGLEILHRSLPVIDLAFHP